MCVQGDSLAGVQEVHELQDRKEKMSEQRDRQGGRMNRATESRNDEHGRGQKCLTELENKKEGKQLANRFYVSFILGVF